MAQLQKSSACLRIGSDDLDPNEITKLLGATPTQAFKKGDQVTGAKTGRTWVKKIGMWQLEATDREPEDMDGQIQEILGQTTSDLTVWKSLRERHDIDLFCGWFMDVGNEGLSLSPESLLALGERGIELVVDIYGGDDGEDEPPIGPDAPAFA